MFLCIVLIVFLIDEYVVIMMIIWLGFLLWICLRIFWLCMLGSMRLSSMRFIFLCLRMVNFLFLV